MGELAILPDNDDETGDDDHAAFLELFHTVAEAEQDERQQALEDRRFVTIAGAQWEGDWGDQFENSLRVEIDKTSQGVERIMDDYRANRVSVNYRAVDKGASDETAETLNGMYRADFYRSHGQQIVDNAFEEAVQGGYGAWRLTNEYVDENDPDNDEQQISFKLQVDADQSVYWVGGRLYDKSDADGCFVVSALSPREFNKEYPDAAHSSWPEGFMKPFYDWFTPDVIRVAEYYAVEHVTQPCRYFKHVATGEERREFGLTGAESAALVTEGWELLRIRKIRRRRIHKRILSGMETLEDKGFIAGSEIPVIPVYGKRHIVDNVERVRGHVRKAKDPQRVYNSQITKLTETSALSPIERPIFTPEQVSRHEDSWARANIERHPYALLNAILDKDGNPMPAGAIGKIEPPVLPPVTAAIIQITAGDIAELTNSQDDASEVKANVSAEAMDIAATRIDAKSFTYMDNFRQSMQRCGEVYLSMAREVYVEEGRAVETMDKDGKEPGTATLAEPYTDERGVFSIRNDIAEGNYKVISDVGEATTTRRDKTVKTLVNGSQVVAAFDPELASAMMGTAMLNMDGEGMDDLQDWMRERLVGAGIVKPTEEEQRAMDEAEQGQQPDPQVEQAQATTGALLATAEKEHALAGKAVADTKLSEAKTTETLAKAHEHRTQGVFGRLSAMFQPKSK
jgi:hypothetical protein